MVCSKNSNKENLLKQHVLPWCTTDTTQGPCDKAYYAIHSPLVTVFRNNLKWPISETITCNARDVIWRTDYGEKTVSF